MWPITRWESLFFRPYAAIRMFCPGADAEPDRNPAANCPKSRVHFKQHREKQGMEPGFKDFPVLKPFALFSFPFFNKAGNQYADLV